MKKIITNRMYIYLWCGAALLSLLSFYALGMNNSLNIKAGRVFMYSLIIFAYIFFIIEGVFIHKKIKELNMKPIKMYDRLTVVLIIFFIATMHVLFWYFYFNNISFSMEIVLGGSCGLVRNVLANRIYISSKFLVIGNKKYDINDLFSVKDSFGSNVYLTINEKTISVYCGSRKAKKEVIKYLNQRSS